jgi:uncharacterized protein YkwD
VRAKPALPSKRATPRRFRPGVESLETRALPGHVLDGLLLSGGTLSPTVTSGVQEAVLPDQLPDAPWSDYSTRAGYSALSSALARQRPAFRSGEGYVSSGFRNGEWFGSTTNPAVGPVNRVTAPAWPGTENSRSSAVESLLASGLFLPEVEDATGTAPGGGSQQAAPSGGGSALSSTVSQLLQLHNQARAQTGKPPLRLDTRLNAAAQNFANYMRSTGRFGHSVDGRSAGQRFAAQGYRAATWGENIGRGYGSAAGVTQAWLNSSGHRANVLNSTFRDVGFGVSGNYWVADFAAP